MKKFSKLKDYPTTTPDHTEIPEAMSKKIINWLYINTKRFKILIPIHRKLFGMGSFLGKVHYKNNQPEWTKGFESLTD